MSQITHIRKQGIIQDNGMILSDDGQLYEPDMIFEDTILLAMSSWTRFAIKDVVNKTVEFTIYVPKNTAYNFELKENK